MLAFHAHAPAQPRTHARRPGEIVTRTALSKWDVSVRAATEHPQPRRVVKPDTAVQPGEQQQQQQWRNHVVDYKKKTVRVRSTVDPKGGKEAREGTWGRTRSCYRP